MYELLGIAIGQVIGALLLSALNAALLQWRARVRRSWIISFRNAYRLCLKAALIALLISDIAIFTSVAFGGTNADLLRNVALLFGLVSWWFAHSNGLLKLAGPSIPLATKEARALSANVFAYFLGAIFVLSLAVAVVFSLLSSSK